MLDAETKRRIDSCHRMLVGKVPDAKSQVEQITLALIYKFMDDMDALAEAEGGRRTFFAGDFARYGWGKLLAPQVSGVELIGLYSKAIAMMPDNPGIPPLFRDIFKNAFLPYRDPETLRSFLQEINHFTYDHSERLGDAFEYLLSVLGSQGDAGQFRTPGHIIDFIVGVVDPQKTETILDPACGTAGFLVSSYKHILAANKTAPLTDDERVRLAGNLLGYDISPDMVRLSLVNLYLHGFTLPQIAEYDTLTRDEKWKQHADVIFANPPFLKGRVTPHERFSLASHRSEVLFVDYVTAHLTPQGRAGVIVPEGLLFKRGKAYKALRKMLVENYLIAVVSLPVGVFQPYSRIKTSILILDRKLAKQSGSMLFVKITADGFGLDTWRRAVSENDLPAATRHLRAWQSSLRDGTSFDASDATIQAVEKVNIAARDGYALVREAYAFASDRGNAAWERERLDALCVITAGRKNVHESDPSGQYPFFTCAREPRFTNEYSFDTEAILVSGNRDVGAAKYFWGKFEAYQRVYVLHRFANTLLPRYLYYVLRCGLRPYLDRLKQGSQTAFIKREMLDGCLIAIPPLAVQKKITEQLDRYQKIIDGARLIVDNYQPQIDVHPEWPRAALGSICKINPRRSFLARLPEKTEVSFLSMADVTAREMFLEAPDVHALGDIARHCSCFQDNDVLLASISPCFENGKTGIARNLRNGIGFGTGAVFVLRAEIGAVLPEWIYLQVTTEEFRTTAERTMRIGNGGFKRISQDFLRDWIISVPDLETQKSMVAERQAQQQTISANLRLISQFEDKIRAVIHREML